MYLKVTQANTDSTLYVNALHVESVLPGLASGEHTEMHMMSGAIHYVTDSAESILARVDVYMRQGEACAPRGIIDANLARHGGI